MPHVVRVSDPGAVEELLAALTRARAEVRRRGARTIVVSDPGHDDDLETELAFFLKAWALSHPTLEVELEGSSRSALRKFNTG